MKIKIALAVFITILVGVSAFFLIPKEETLQNVTVVNPHKETTYEFTTVKFGDIVKSRNVTCKYNATIVEQLYFGVDGYEIEEVFVKSGDVVKKGELLATLKLEDLESQLKNCEKSIEKLDLQLSQINETIKLVYRNQTNYIKTLDNDELVFAQTAKEAISPYEDQKSNIENSLWIEELRLAEIKEKIAQRQIYAPIDGVVSYACEVEKGTYSKKSTLIIEVLDDTTSLFIFESNHGELFEVNDEIDIEVDDIIYSAKIAEKYYDEKKESYCYYIKLVESQITFNNGDRGLFEVVYEEYLDVLYLPSKAIKQSKGKDIVYYINQDGVRDVKYVEIGIESEGYTSIISGVEEGEEIVVGWN